MRKKYSILILLVLALISCAPKEKAKIKITYFAQSGVFIQADTTKIFVDAVFEGDPRWVYPSPSEELLDSIEMAIPPYDNITLFLVTHAHIDHFGAKVLENSLISNPQALLVTTREVRGYMSNVCEDYSRIEKQVIVPDIAYNASLDTIIRGVPLLITHLKHHNDEDWACIVYSFLIKLNGKKILHNAGSTGYFPDEYKKVQYDTMGIDVAILYKDFLMNTSPTGKEVIDKYIKPHNILIGHMDNTNENFMDSLKLANEVSIPNLSVMKKQGEWWEY